LVLFDKLDIYGVNSFSEVEVTIASILLPGDIFIPDHRLTVSALPPKMDMLIGMDIIRMGDLVICNAENKTVISFTVPPAIK
jgi:hypothetical protein